MVEWACPHCGYKEYSAWERREHEFVTCGNCGTEYRNRYYDPHFKREAR